MRERIRAWYPALLALPALLGAGSNAAADGEALVRESCAGCHAIEPIDYRALGIQERLERQAPPLYYAGNKYREEWLVQWLQAPHAIYPEGYLALGALRAGEDGDVLEAGDSADHPALSEDEAQAAAEFLMSLAPHDELLEATGYEPGSPALRMAMMHFRRFNACSACHLDEPGGGGVSGPELYTAGERLQPRFIASYIADPTAWDPYSAMPATGLNREAVHRLADYLLIISEE